MMARRIALMAMTAVLVLAGCAAPATHQAMTVEQPLLTRQHDRTVSVKTAGGAETSAIDSSNIADADFKQAIEASIAQSRLFRGVLPGSGADYELLVSITQLDKPIFGLTFTVKMEATWVLLRSTDRQIVMKESVRSAHTATFGDAAAGVTRLRLALEGAAKRNIEQGLQKIAALSL